MALMHWPCMGDATHVETPLEGLGIIDPTRTHVTTVTTVDFA